MGHHIEHNESRQKSLSSGEFTTWFPVVDFNLNLFKRIVSMAEAKILIWVLNYVGLPMAFLGWLLNTLPSTMNSWTASVIGVLGIFFLAAKLVVYCITSYQNIKMKNLHFKSEEKKHKDSL